MSKRVPRNANNLLNKAKESCLLAVDIYNKPKTSFKSGAYVVLMTIAWTSLFHAIFEKKSIKYFHRKKNSNRYVIIDGDKKSWELADCVKEYFKENKKEEIPIRKNLEFFIPLRNKIEHRFMPELDKKIFGECQSLLFNFEKILNREFGSDHSINESLAFSLQFSNYYSKEKKESHKKINSREFININDYIRNFRENLDDEVYSHSDYSFQIYLIPKVGNNKDRAEYAIEWKEFDPDNPKEMEQYKHLVGLMKEKKIHVSNDDKLKPTHVTGEIKPLLINKYGEHIKFSPSSNHNKCAKYFKAIPEDVSKDKYSTNKDWANYDDLFETYVYTKKWVDYLKKKLVDEEMFYLIFPNQKPTK